jgi:hypothetical protein
MRSARNFHPETHYGAATGLLVAMAIGVIASGEVFFSLVDVKMGQALSVVSQTLAAPAQPPIAAPQAAKLQAKTVEPASQSEADDRLGAPVNESSATSKTAEPAGGATSLTEVLPEPLTEATTPPSPAAPKKTVRNVRVERHPEPRVARGGYGAWGWGGSASHLY